MDYRSKLCVVAAVALAIAIGAEATPGSPRRFRSPAEAESPRRPTYGSHHSPPDEYYYAPASPSVRSPRPRPSAPPSPPAFARSPSFLPEPRPYFRRAPMGVYAQSPSAYSRESSPAAYSREPTPAAAYAREPSPAAYAREAAPSVGSPRPATGYPAYPRVAPRFSPRRFRPGSVSTSAAVGGGAAAAASSGGRGGASSAVSGGRGGASAASSTHGPESSREVEEERFREHYEEPETENEFASHTGTYANDGRGLETSSFNRNTKSVQSHEDGKETDDNYYNAQSYGETNDENKRVSYDNDDEDVMHTKNMYRSKKSKTSFLSDHNKASRRSGSGVLARDKHSTEYNKDLRKLNEVVKSNKMREGAGVLDTDSFTSTKDIDEEDEMMNDSHGLGNFVGVDGVHHPKRPDFGARGMSASAASGSGSSAASVSLGH